MCACLCRIALWRHIVPSRRPFWQHLAYVLSLPCAVLRHHAVLVPASTESTASIKLASVAEGATTAKPEALERWARGEDGGGLQGAREPACEWASGCLRHRCCRGTWSGMDI